MLHPNTKLQFINDEVGYGVVATKFIPAGTITWVLDKLDQQFTQAQFESMEEVYQEILDTYTFRDNQGNYVLCWDNGRFVNHSFNSNCLSTSYDFEIAIRDIHEGEQLTDDYGYLNVSKPFQGVDEGTERKIVYPDDLLRYSAEWDSKISHVFHKVPTIDQPLRTLISSKTWNEVLSVSSGEKMLQSIRNLYFHGQN